MHTVKKARGFPPAGVLFIVDRNAEDVYWGRRIFGHHSNDWPFVQSVQPGTPCFVFRIHTNVRAPPTHTADQRVASPM